MNIRFSYLYRDGANYKQYHSVIFSNDANLPIAQILDRITAALIDHTWFYADKWKLKDLHYHPWDNELDHTWHEFEGVELTEEPANAGDINTLLTLI